MRNRFDLITGFVVVCLATVVLVIAIVATHVPTFVPSTKSNPDVSVIPLDFSLAPSAPLWREEIRRRFPHAIGIFVHGGDIVQGQWIAETPFHATPMKELVEGYKKVYPNWTIVLIACNPGHLDLGVPGVYYAHDNVWVMPDRSLTPGMMDSRMVGPLFDLVDESKGPKKTRWEINPGCVGSIFEFTCD